MRPCCSISLICHGEREAAGTRDFRVLVSWLICMNRLLPFCRHYDYNRRENYRGVYANALDNGSALQAAIKAAAGGMAEDESDRLRLQRYFVSVASKLP